MAQTSSKIRMAWDKENLKQYKFSVHKKSELNKCLEEYEGATATLVKSLLEKYFQIEEKKC